MMIASALFYIFLGSLLVQAVFYLVVFPRLVFFKGGCRRRAEKPHPVSVIICARNEASNLAVLVPWLFRQDYGAFEVIVVNDRSSDNTHEILDRLGGEYPGLRQVTVHTVPENVNPKKYGLVQGIAAARHELLLFTDGDCMPAGESWIRAMVAPFDPATQIILGYSPYEKEPGLLNLFIRFETLYTGIQYLSLALAGRPYMGVGRNMAYKKSFFSRQGGFQRHMTVTGGDDDLFVNRSACGENTKITVGKESLVFSGPEKGWNSYFKQKRRHLSVGKFYRVADKLILGVLSLSHIIFWVTFAVLAVQGEEPYFVFGGFLVRMIGLGLVFYFAAKKLGDQVNPLYLPLLDFLYVCYYMITGISAIITKNIKWS